MRTDTPVKYAYRVSDVRQGQFGDLPLLSVSISKGVVPRSEISDKEARADDLSNYKVVSRGDIVINRMSAYQGALGLVKSHGIVSPDYLVLRPCLSADAAFLTFLFKSNWFVGEMTSRLRGIGGIEQGNVRTPRINADDLGSIPVTLPPLSVQRAIASYLDTETARIDALIDKKKRMVEVARERFVRHIDEIMSLEPQEDKAPALSAVVQIAEGQVDPRKLQFSELPLIAPNHLESGSGRILDLESAAEQGAISGKYLCEAGDVIYSKIRPSLRKACIAPTRCLTSADMYPMRPNARLMSKYLFFFLLSNRFTDFAVAESERVAMPKINRDAFGRIRIPIPNQIEQRRAIATLEAIQGWTAEIVDRLEKQRRVLIERRQALITAAVTGQLEDLGVVA